MKKLCLLFIVYSLLIIAPWFAFPVYAGYVLPYPSFMPGNKIYKISRIIDSIGNWWNFGSITQVKYHLKLSDKYLVESKTLFEYQQYLLAYDALSRSNSEFLKIPAYRARAWQEGKDIRYLEDIVLSAAKKHTEVLTSLGLSVPTSFLWVPEKSQSTQLDLQVLMSTSIDVRNQVIRDISSQ